MKCRLLVRASLLSLLPTASAAAGGGPGWVEFNEETATRLITDDAGVGALDTQEKDYAWGDVDQDGDTDLVVVRKQGWTTGVGRRNVLFMNEGTADGQALDGVLVDRTAQYIPDFLDLTNDRDVVLADVNGDGRPDIVTAVTLGGLASPKEMTHPRVYINLGDDSGGAWQGYVFDDVDRIPTFPFEPRFNAVAPGDFDNDGDLDLYFVDSDKGPYSRGGDLNDRLLANDGTGYFTDVTAAAMTPPMANSVLGETALFADLNLDGANDIVTSDGIHTLEAFYNAGDGTFDVLDIPYVGAALYVSAGDLNADDRPDLVFTDDGTDRYLLNTGNGPDGLANFSNNLFPVVTNGFGEEILVVDLDFDGRNDVVIADVDMDVPGCTRTTHLLHNVGSPSTPSFVADAGNIPQNMRTGCHDVAIFDLDRDGLNDIIFGRCSVTQIWMGVPHLAMAFTYPSGLPDLLPPEAPAPFEVAIEAVGEALDPDSPAIHVSVGGGPFQATPLDLIGGNLYIATLPPAACLEPVAFYVSGALEGGATFTDPPGAPASTYVAVAAAATSTLFSDSIEGDVSEWTVTSDPSLVTGQWEQADPNQTLNGPTLIAPEDDATPGGTMAFVTEIGSPGEPNNTHDVDGGPTYLISPVFDLEGSDAVVSCARWIMSVFGVHDTMAVDVSNDGGASWTLVETIESTQSAWATASFRVGAFVTPTAQVRVRFGVSDSPNDSATEAGIDDFQVAELVCEVPCPWDLDGSGTVGIADLLALLAAWGDPWGIKDLLAILGNWGPCP